MSNSHNLKNVIIVLNFLSLVFYYSSITLYGYWPDALFLLLTMFFTIMIWNQLRGLALRRTLRLIYTINFIVLLVSPYRLMPGEEGVHFMSMNPQMHNATHAYFIERGNQGMLNRCYGEIQLHRQISWLPFVEILTEVDDCAQMDYNSIINGE